MANNRFPDSFAGVYPKAHNQRELKVIETALESARKDVEDNFSMLPLCGADVGGGAATGTAGDINLLNSGLNLYEYHIKGTQTILAPAFSANGLDISMDQTDNDGMELSLGVTARCKSAYTVGGQDGKSFFAELQLSIADVSGTDDCAFGFRKAEAYQANIDDYDEMAVLNVISGDVKIETILNNAATATTDTTLNLADAGTVKLRLEVDKAGRLSTYVDGTRTALQPNFKFDAGEVVVPFFFFLHSSDVAGVTNLKSFRSGLI